MGNAQSSGTETVSPNAAKKICYYELLGVSSDAADTE